MGSTAQTLSILIISIKSLAFRPRQAVFAVLGFAGVALVFCGVLSVAVGVDFVLSSAGSADTALVLSRSAANEESSSLSVDQVRLAETLAEQSRGFSSYSTEFVSVVKIPKISDGVSEPLLVRGLTRSAFHSYQHFRLIKGRLPKPGLNELIAGRLASMEYRWLTVGALQHWGNQTWRVVGIFSSDHDVHESELWTGFNALRSAYNAGNSTSVVRIKFSSVSALHQFRNAVNEDPVLKGVVRVDSERSYYAVYGHYLRHLVLSAGLVIFVLMGASALLGTLNIMLLILKARVKDIALMSALGFRQAALAYAYLLESLLYGLIGSLIGAVLSWLIFNGRNLVTSAGASQIAVELLVGPVTILIVVGVVLLVAFLAGLVPAIRVMNQTIPIALRAE